MVRLQLVQKVDNAADDSIWTLSWVPGKRQLATGSVDESVLIWEETGTAEDVTVSLVHTLVRLCHDFESFSRLDQNQAYCCDIYITSSSSSSSSWYE